MRLAREGGPIPLAIPVQQGVAREAQHPIPKELGPPSLEGGMLGNLNRKKESRIEVDKRQGREQHVKIEQMKV